VARLAGGPAAEPAALLPAPDLERARLLESAVGLVEHAARARPVVLLLEDVHQADVPSLELTGYVARRLAKLPVLLVLTRREAPARPAVDALLDELRRRGLLHAELELAPLPPAAIAELVATVAVLTPPQVERVVEASDGSPLLALESARSPGTTPGLRAHARASLAPLASPLRTLCELVAVAGRPLTRTEVEALWAEPGAPLAAAAECGLLHAPSGRLAYRHALLREAVHDDLGDARRADLHDRFAAMLCEQGTAPPAERARHLRLAGRDPEAARELAAAAADARAVGALPEAAAFLEEALEIRPKDVTLWLDLAGVEAWRGRRPALEQAFETATGLLDSADDLAHAEAHALRGDWYTTSLCVPRQAHGSFAIALERLDKLQDPPRGLLLEVLADLAVTRAWEGRAEDSDALIARAQRLVDAGTPADVVAALDRARAQARIADGEFGAAYEPLLAAADGFERAHRPDCAYAAWITVASAAACAGEFEAALDCAERGIKGVGNIGTLLLQLHSARAYILARLGRHDEAAAAAREQALWADRVGDPALRAVALHDTAMIAFQAGRYDEAATGLADALAQEASVPRAIARIVRAEALQKLDRLDEAEAELRAATLEPVGPADLPATLVPRLTRVQGLIAAARGDRELAARRLNEALAGWRRRVPGRTAAEAFNMSLVDLGRPPVAGLIEPGREIARLERELAGLRTEVPA
jgi:tetratricopeptide (TPR) repeat protein